MIKHIYCSTIDHYIITISLLVSYQLYHHIKWWYLMMYQRQYHWMISLEDIFWWHLLMILSALIEVWITSCHVTPSLTMSLMQDQSQEHVSPYLATSCYSYPYLSMSIYCNPSQSSSVCSIDEKHRSMSQCLSARLKGRHFDAVNPIHWDSIIQSH